MAIKLTGQWTEDYVEDFEITLKDKSTVCFTLEIPAERLTDFIEGIGGKEKLEGINELSEYFNFNEQFKTFLGLEDELFNKVSRDIRYYKSFINQIIPIITKHFEAEMNEYKTEPIVSKRAKSKVVSNSIRNGM